MRTLLAGAVILSIASGIIVTAGVTAIAAFLSQQGLHQAGWTVLAVMVGSLGTLLVTRRLARENRLIEAKDIAASLHAEIADRAARCLNDYVKPWKTYEDEAYTQPKVPPLSWVSKFRPVEPVVYPAVAAKLGLLAPDALFPVVEF
jgi:hypothetical protein